MKIRRSPFWFSHLLVCLCLLAILTPLSATATSISKASSSPVKYMQHGESIQASESVFDLPAIEFSSISAGGRHTCALTTDGGVKCWGYNGYGELGDGTTTHHSTPVDVVVLSSGVSAVIAGSDHTCALTSSGGVKCWGWNRYGQLGDGTTDDRSTPVDVVGMSSEVSAVVAGGDHACIITSSGGVKCWGYNGYGELGDGTTDDRSTPVDVVGLNSGVIAVAAGGWHTCALTTGGGVKCWGSNWYGQLGDGTTDDRSTPVDVVGLSSGVSAVAAGRDHSCALTKSGGIKCWGGNRYGQLGDGTKTQRSTPVDVVGLSSGVSAVAAGGWHTCALTTFGGVKCWGVNNGGTVPQDISGLTSGVSAVAVGESHTCAVTTSGVVKCWGGNWDGQLGDGTRTRYSTPVDVFGFSIGMNAIDAGGAHTCALKPNGGAECWGENNAGQLGDGTTTDKSIPVDVEGLPDGVIAISAGYEHTCALTSIGAVKCWGWNGDGQLGDGTSEDRNTPVNVVGLEQDAIAVTAGDWHSCALAIGGAAKCWGDNMFGQLGDGSDEASSIPVNVLGLGSGVVTITAGSLHTCALTTAGGVKCWGANSGGSVPQNVSGLASGVTAIAAGADHTCALTTAGGVKCWGRNHVGQLGDGTSTDNIYNPVDVIGLSSGVSKIIAGYFHTCALTTNGGVKCWGDNDDGQVGDGNLGGFHTTPVDVLGLSGNVSHITAGGFKIGGSHTCALAGSGRPKCWGLASQGQLGIGVIPIIQLTPVNVLESIPPSLNVSYPYGQSGSYFTITGWDFPPNTQASLDINGVALPSTVTVSPTGTFIVFLDTGAADPGSYFVTAGVNPSATTSFILGDDAPLRPIEGDGQTFDVPVGISYDDFMFLPILMR